MKKMRNTFYIIFSLLLALAIAGCSQGNSVNSANTEETGKTSNAETKTDDPKKISFPEKEITLYVPYSAGGSNDTAARIFAEFLTKHLGQTVVVENKPGAGGVTQTTGFAREKANGYALQFSADDPFTTLNAMHDNINFSEEDFEFLMGVLSASNVIAVNSNSPYNTMEDLIKDAQENDKIINFGHPGVGTVPHFSGEAAFKEIGIKAQQIPFDGGGQALNALLAGDLDVQVTPEATIIPQVEAGKVRALAVTSGERSSFLEVPTLKELGFDVDMGPLMSVYAPAGLPADVKDVLIEAINKVLSDSEFKDAVAELNLKVDGRSGEEVVKYFQEVRPKYEEVAKKVQ